MPVVDRPGHIRRHRRHGDESPTMDRAGQDCSPRQAGCGSGHHGRAAWVLSWHWCPRV